MLVFEPGAGNWSETSSISLIFLFDVKSLSALFGTAGDFTARNVRVALVVLRIAEGVVALRIVFAFGVIAI